MQVPLPGAPLWLGASLTITSIVLATKLACPSLLSPLTQSKQTDNDQVSQNVLVVTTCVALPH